MKKRYISPTIDVDHISSENTFATTSMAWQMKTRKFNPLNSSVSMSKIENWNNLLKGGFKSLKIDFTKYK